VWYQGGLEGCGLCGGVGIMVVGAMCGDASLWIPWSTHYTPTRNSTVHTTTRHTVVTSNYTGVMGVYERMDGNQ
jgi:hypothetical protein